MAVEIIDLTGSASSPILIDDVEESAVTVSNSAEKERKKRKKLKRNHREHREQDDRWKHDKYSHEARNGVEKSYRDNEDEDEDGGDSRRRKKSARSPSPFFTVDTTPGDVVGGLIPIPLATDGAETTPPTVKEPSSNETSLLLPVHVTLAVEDFQSIPDNNPPLSPVSEASGIDFLDNDRAVGAPRYFDDRATNPKTRGPCKRCGDSDHDFKHCTTIICLTCGARNEHSPRSCPILRFCWNCKGKGHMARECPRIGDMDPRQLDRNDCERCGSSKHHSTNCPTIWRIYTYLTDAESEAVLVSRESKRQLGFDHGGEGYIARDEWCYNCGNSGHLGDDCGVAGANYDKPDDYSAFGSYNQLTGPFASPSSVMPRVTRAPREWEQDGAFDDGYGFSGQTDVGRKGRENAKAKAREAQRLLDEADDEPDWFNRNQSATKDIRRGTPPVKPANRGGLPSKPAPPTIQLGFQKSNSSRPPWASSPGSNVLSSLPPLSSRPSLRDRIDLGEGRGSSKSRREDKRTSDIRQESGKVRGERSQRTNGDKREDDRERNREGDRYGEHKERKRERGSRWRGGYDR